MITLFAATLAAALAAPATPDMIKVSENGAGWLFTDGQGLTLYTYDRDEPGKSACVEQCAERWPPLTVAEGASLSGDWSVLTRDDGRQQAAHRGRPLYRYALDAYPGATFGDTPDGAWHAAFEPIWTPPGFGQRTTLLGVTLTGANGLTLYVNTADAVTDGRVTPGCNKDCAKRRRPVAAPGAVVAAGEWTIVVRPDGSRQWAHLGKPLYAYAGDLAPGDLRGVDEASTWRAAVLQPSAGTPAWVTFQASDAGELLADGKGLTIYALNPDLNRARRSNLSAPATCDDACIRAFWKPVTADAPATPIGNWSTATNADGKLQWAFKGEFLFTHSRDERPGDITGTRFTGSRAWRPIMRSGEPMQGTGGN